VESTVGVGTSFRILLPMENAAAVERPQPAGTV
jgi:hypothetical protein